jgi:recA bacterial DNA recombination protein
MYAFSVLSAAAPGSPVGPVFAHWGVGPGRPFVLPLRSSRPLLAHGGALAKLAALTPASRLEVRPAPEMVSSGIREMDALTGGLPRGCITEICGPASSGRTSVLLAALAGATQRGEVCALVDASDALDPASAAAAGIEMERLLWVRCGKAVASCQLPDVGHSAVRLNCSSPESRESPCPAHTLRTENRELRTVREQRLWESRLEQVLKVTDLLLQSNGFGMIALDLGDVPVGGARRIPLASWFRFRRAVEHTPTVLLVIEQQPIAGSCSSVVVKIAGGRSQVAGKKRLSAIGSQFSANRLAHAELLDQCEITAELMRLRLDRKPVQSATAAFRSRAAWAG